MYICMQIHLSHSAISRCTTGTTWKALLCTRFHFFHTFICFFAAIFTVILLSHSLLADPFITLGTITSGTTWGTLHKIFSFTDFTYDYFVRFCCKPCLFYSLVIKIKVAMYNFCIGVGCPKIKKMIFLPSASTGAK